MVKYDPATRRRGPVSPKPNRFRRFFSLMTSFVLGYTCCSFFDYSHLLNWVTTQIFLSQPKEMPIPAAQTAEIPKPKFEFYTLLTQDRQSSKNMTNVQEQPVALSVKEENKSISHTVNQMNISDLKSQEHFEHREEKAIEASLTEANEMMQAPVNMRESYLVQLASFRRSQDAEKLKATLALKGFHVMVMPVTQQRTQWFRVVLGPFNNKIDAQRAQNAVFKNERIAGMIRKMDA